MTNPPTPLSKEERKALAMHELMKREQLRKTLNRFDEQRRIAGMSDEQLRAIVNDEKVD